MEKRIVVVGLKGFGKFWERHGVLGIDEWPSPAEVAAVGR